MKTQMLLVLFMSFCVNSYGAEKSPSTLIYYGMESFLEDVADPMDQDALPKTYRMLLPNLSVPIEFVYMPFKRMQRRLTENKPACNFYALENLERKNHFLFSLPLTFLPSPRVYTRSPVAEYLLNANGEIKSLSQTVQAQQGNVILLTEGISYGDELDKFVKQIPGGNVVWRASGDRHNKISEMFFKNRTQMALIYPQEAHQFLTSHSVKPNEFYSYGIEGVPPIVGGKIMCNKSPENEVFLKAFNQAILSLYDNQEYISTQQLHTPEALRTLLNETIIDVKNSHSLLSE